MAPRPAVVACAVRVSGSAPDDGRRGHGGPGGGPGAWQVQGGDFPLATSILRGAPSAPRWSWQLTLAILVAAAPVLAMAPATARLIPTGRQQAPAVPPQPPPGAAVGIAVDGRPLPVAGTVLRGAALAPAGLLAEALGGFVEQGPSGGSTIFLGGHIFTVLLHPSELEVDGATDPVAVEPEVWNAQVYVPVRPIAAALGVSVQWVPQMASVEIETGLPVPAAAPLAAAPQRAVLQPPPAAADELAAQPTAVAQPMPVIPYSVADLTLIGRVIHGEADGEPYLARVGVAAVIVNRVRAPGFPKGIPAVIYAPNQFQAVGAPLFELGPDAEDTAAAVAALHGDDPTGGALYFYNPDMTWSGSWIFTRRTLVTYGEIRFAT